MSTVRQPRAGRSAAAVLPVPSYRVLSTPRLGEDRDGTGRVEGDINPDVIAALIGAHVATSAVGVCWVRSGPQRHVNVLVGPATLAAEDRADRDEVRLLFPAGAEARRLTPEEAASLLGRMTCWVACAAGFDPLAAEDPAETARVRPPTLEDCFGQLSHAAIAWLVQAEPIEPAVVAEMLESLAFRLPEVRNRAETSEANRIALEREEAWYRELERCAGIGLWRVRAAAGAGTEPDARRVATLLCHSADVRPLPFRMRPGRPAASLDDALRALDSGEAAEGFLATHELLAAIARPPVSEIPGVRFVRPPPFDVTSESSGPFRLGDTLDETLRPCGRFSVSNSTLNRHAFVCGATGSGKSQTVRTLLESVTRARIPWLVIEPAKAEYAAGMAGRLERENAEVTVIRVGDPSLMPGSLNPLEPEPGFPLQSHADMVRALFLAAFDADEPFPQVLSYALTRCYESCGWDLALSRPAPDWPSNRPPRYPNLGDVQEAAKRVVAEIGYGREVTDNVRGFVDVRIRSLRTGSPGRFFQGGHPLVMALMMSGNVVFEMEDVAGDQDKAFLIGAVLIRLFEHLRVRSAHDPARSLRHVTVVEEAHRLLRRVEGHGSTSQAVELFANLLAEIRSYGEGIVVAEQIPSKVIPDLIKNTALKVVHRLPAADDREAVGATMNLTQPQSEYVVTLGPGRAAVFVDGMDRPVLAAITYEGEERERGHPGLVPPVGAARRSATCGPDCCARACTLEEMRLAQAFADATPGLALWVELAYVCHLVGEPLGGPSDAWLRPLRDIDSRRRDCALSQLVDGAVDARYRHLRLFFRPEDLAEHVWSAINSRLRGGGGGCAGGELEWRAGTRRWLDVRLALEQDAGERSRAHPATDAWARRGLRLPAAGWMEQLAVAQAHPWSWYPAQRELELGVEESGAEGFCRSGLGRALTGLVGSATPAALDAGLMRVGLELTNAVFNRLVGYSQAEPTAETKGS